MVLLPDSSLSFSSLSGHIFSCTRQRKQKRICKRLMKESTAEKGRDEESNQQQGPVSGVFFSRNQERLLVLLPFCVLPNRDRDLVPFSLDRLERECCKLLSFSLCFRLLFRIGRLVCRAALGKGITVAGINDPFMKPAYMVRCCFFMFCVFSSVIGASVDFFPFPLGLSLEI